MRRRQFLAGATALSFAAPPGPAGAEDEPFSRSVVLQRARALAGEPFAWPEPAVPEALPSSPPRTTRGIRFREDRRLFVDPPTGFAVELLHSGFIYNVPVEIFVVEGGVARKIAYDPALFTFGDVPSRRSRARCSSSPASARSPGSNRPDVLQPFADLRRRELLPGDLQGPALRPQRARPRDRHRRGGGRGVPVLPRPLAGAARRRPDGGALAARRPERRRRLPLHHPPRRASPRSTSRRRSSPAPTSRTSASRR